MTQAAENSGFRIEILSPSNSQAEMDEKKLYFAHGALEFWTCGPKGKCGSWATVKSHKPAI